MELVLVDKSNYNEAIKIQNSIFPKENGALNILASLDRKLFIKITGLKYVDDHVRYFLAKKDNTIVGITGLYYYDLDNAWLGWFGILSEFRNNGFGRELLSKTIELASTMKFKNIRLYTDFVDNRNAIRLYEEEGFVGEKYTAENLSYDCRIYSKSLTNNNIRLWNNKNLNLCFQSKLDHTAQNKINEILKRYDEIFKR